MWRVFAKVMGVKGKGIDDPKLSFYIRVKRLRLQPLEYFSLFVSTEGINCANSAAFEL